MTETLQTPVRELTTGSTFAGRYQVIEELGHGGMGRVYKVQDTDIKEKVALKLLRPEISLDKETLERFSNELKLARKISHRNVCRMFDLGRAEGTTFITMEFVPGEDLKSFLHRAKQLSIGTAVSIAKQVCEGLEEAHRLGVIHRDLKPGNIMIDKDGDAKIMDFGIARSLSGKGITGAGVLIGTPEYMSPEQVDGKEVDQRSDLYSLGVILYEMVTGRIPFSGDTPLSVAHKHKYEAPEDPKKLNAHVSDDLAGVILKCLAKDRNERYRSAAELGVELGRIEAGLPTTDRIIPKKKGLTSKEITVKFNLRKVLVPAFIILVLAVAAILLWRYVSKKGTTATATAKKSIAVLPFDDLSPAKDHEYLCKGIAETLINSLSNIKDLWVPARATSFSFEGKNLSIREIGRQLAVDNLLEASVQVIGNKLRIISRIVNTKNGSQVWSNQYDRQLGDVFTIQDEIAQEIVKALKIKLLGEKEAPLVKNYTQNLEGYNLYMKGRFFWEKRTKEDLEKAAEYFQAAIQQDPNYSLAYAGLADAYGSLGASAFWLPDEAFPKAKTAALKALEIDGNVAEAHTSLGLIKTYYDWDFPGAELEFQKAIKINPSYPTAHHFYAMLLSDLGRHDEALVEIKLARTLDPLSPRINANVGGRILYQARQYDQALEELRKVLEMYPNDLQSLIYLGRVTEALGRYEEALKYYRRNIELGEGSESRSPNIAYVYALMGKREEARRILNSIIAYSKQNFFSKVYIAEIFAALGEKDQVFAWLGKAFIERAAHLVFLKVNPKFDLVRQDPRFTELLRKIGLEK